MDSVELIDHLTNLIKLQAEIIKEQSETIAQLDAIVNEGKIIS